MSSSAARAAPNAAPGEWGIAEELAGEDWRLVTLEGGSGEVTAEVAHEQILRKWPALEGWLSELRDFLTWKAELEAARAAYDETPPAEKAGALLSGRRLLIARNWLASHGDDLAPEDRAFVEASIKADDELRERARQQERKILVRTRIGAGGALIFALIAGTIGRWAWDQRAEANEPAKSSSAQESLLSFSPEWPKTRSRTRTSARRRCLRWKPCPTPKR